MIIKVSKDDILQRGIDECLCKSGKYYYLGISDAVMRAYIRTMDGTIYDYLYFNKIIKRGSKCQIIQKMRYKT